MHHSSSRMNATTSLTPQSALPVARKPAPVRTPSTSTAVMAALVQRRVTPLQISALQRTIGNAATGRLMRTSLEDDKKKKIQAKYTVGKPGDVYEKEADQVAEQVVRMPESDTVSRSTVRLNPG